MMSRLVLSHQRPELSRTSSRHSIRADDLYISDLVQPTPGLTYAMSDAEHTLSVRARGLNRFSLAQIKIWPRIVHQIWHFLSCGRRWAPRTSRYQQFKLSRPNGLGPRMVSYNEGRAIGQRDCTLD